MNEILQDIAANINSISHSPWGMWTTISTFFLGAVAITPIAIEFFREKSRFKGAISVNISSNGVFKIKNIWTKPLVLSQITQKIKTIDFPDDPNFIRGPYNDIDPLEEQHVRAENMAIFKSKEKELEQAFFKEIKIDIEETTSSVEEKMEIVLAPNEEIVFGKTSTNRLPKKMSGALGYLIETEVEYKRNAEEENKSKKKYAHYYSIFIDPTDSWIRTK